MLPRPRYAVYFTPAPRSALATFGCAVLGYDVDTGRDHDFAASLGLAFRRWHTLVAEPARYGFHATLKAPFELTPETAEADLLAAARGLAARLPVQDLGFLEVAQMGRHVALLPRTPAAGSRCAEAVVRAFDHMRAPLSEADRSRRLEAPLTPRQIVHLDRWGYPFVFDAFQFHMTLAGPLEPALTGPVCDALHQLYTPASMSVALDAISILKQPQRSDRFVVVERFALAPPAA